MQIVAHCGFFLWYVRRIIPIVKWSTTAYVFEQQQNGDTSLKSIRNDPYRWGFRKQCHTVFPVFREHSIHDRFCKKMEKKPSKKYKIFHLWPYTHGHTDACHGWLASDSRHTLLWNRERPAIFSNSRSQRQYFWRRQAKNHSMQDVLIFSLNPSEKLHYLNV